MSKKNAEEIAAINDKFRKTGQGGKILATASILNAYPVESVDAIMELVRDDTNFTRANDPHGEHDFGTVEMDGEKFYWKIDYYDQNYEYGEDPLSTDCCRVLTIMKPEDY